jgi:hypothetical protein
MRLSYKYAVAYLRQSSAAAALIDFLEKESHRISVLCIEAALNGFAPKEWVSEHCNGVEGSLVRWCPFKAMGVKITLNTYYMGILGDPMLKI